MGRPKREGIVVDPRSILRMRVEREKMPWTELHLESKARSHQSAYLKKILSALRNFSQMDENRCEEGALNCSRLLSIIRKHSDLEFLVSGWSVESYTFAAKWGEFFPTLKDVAVS